MGVVGVLSILSWRAGVSEGKRQLPLPEIEIRTLLLEQLQIGVLCNSTLAQVQCSVLLLLLCNEVDGGAVKH